MTRPTPRPGLLDISPYVPGKSKPGQTRTYKLSANESGLGPAPSAITAAEEAARKLHLYPDGSASALRAKIGALHGIDPARLIVGNGSDEMLSLSVRCFTSPGDEVLMTRHGFAYYPLVARAEGCVPVMAEEADLTADVDTLLAAVTDKTRVLLLANPNNPTGTRLPHEEVLRLRESLREDILLVLDGAYAEYIEDESYDAGIGFVERSIASGADNVIMTRTFSKIYGLGGLRIGWAYAAPSVIDVLNRARPPFNANASALAAAEAALDDQAFLEENRQHNVREMARLEAALTRIGYAVRTSEANFFLLDFASAEDAQAFLRFMEERGVYIRGLTSSNLPRHLRVSVGSAEANNAFLEAAEAWTAR